MSSDLRWGRLQWRIQGAAWGPIVAAEGQDSAICLACATHVDAPPWVVEINKEATQKTRAKQDVDVCRLRAELAPQSLQNG